MSLFYDFLLPFISLTVTSDHVYDFCLIVIFIVDEYFTYGARKTAGPVPRGVEGVLAFYLQRPLRRRRPLRRIPSRTLVIMFSVPFLNTRPFYNNQFYLKSFDGKLDEEDVNKNLFNEMYRDTKNRFKGDNTWHRDFELDEYVEADCLMSSAGTAVIQIDVKRKRRNVIPRRW